MFLTPLLNIFMQKFRKYKCNHCWGKNIPQCAFIVNFGCTSGWVNDLIHINYIYPKTIREIANYLKILMPVDYLEAKRTLLCRPFPPTNVAGNLAVSVNKRNRSYIQKDFLN